MRFVVWCYRRAGAPLLPVADPARRPLLLPDRPEGPASLAPVSPPPVRAARAARRRWGAGRPGGTPSVHYHAYGLSILDRVGFWLGRGRRLHHRPSTGRSSSRGSRQEGRGAIILGAHLGSFDALRVLARRGQVVVNVVMFIEHARMINSIFQALDRGRVPPGDPARSQLRSTRSSRSRPASSGASSWRSSPIGSGSATRSAPAGSSFSGTARPSRTARSCWRAC